MCLLQHAWFLKTVFARFVCVPVPLAILQIQPVDSQHGSYHNRMHVHHLCPNCWYNIITIHYTYTTSLLLKDLLQQLRTRYLLLSKLSNMQVITIKCYNLRVSYYLVYSVDSEPLYDKYGSTALWSVLLPYYGIDHYMTKYGKHFH